MPPKPLQLTILAAALSFASVYLSLMLAGLGLPLVLAALFAAVCVGAVLHAARPAPPDRSAEETLRRTLDGYLAEVASLRHDLRGVLSPALMVTDRLISHPDPAVQRAGNAVVRSIERATELLSSNKATMAPPGQVSPPDRPRGAA